jgi:peptide/nickel transport system permease protein
MSAILDYTFASTRDSRRHWEIWVGGIVLGCAVLMALAAPWLAPQDVQQIDLDRRFAPAFTIGHLLGTDQLGRDLGMRLALGLRWSLATAVCATLIAFTLGTLLGVLAARGHPWLAKAIRQVTALSQSFPVFVLAVSIVALVGNGFGAICAVLGFVTWPVFCRVVQAETASLSAREYVLAAQMLEMSSARLYAMHILPGLVSSLSVLVPFHFADMLIAESALSFLGIGAPLGDATWGSMLQESRSYLWSAPSLMLLPAAAIVTLVIAGNLLGDGLRRYFA